MQSLEHDDAKSDQGQGALVCFNIGSYLILSAHSRSSTVFAAENVRFIHAVVVVRPRTESEMEGDRSELRLARKHGPEEKGHSQHSDPPAVDTRHLMRNIGWVAHA